MGEQTCTLLNPPAVRRVLDEHGLEAFEEIP
jgi:hypothetical protein